MDQKIFFILMFLVKYCNLSIAGFSGKVWLPSSGQPYPQFSADEDGDSVGDSTFNFQIGKS